MVVRICIHHYVLLFLKKHINIQYVASLCHLLPSNLQQGRDVSGVTTGGEGTLSQEESVSAVLHLGI